MVTVKTFHNKVGLSGLNAAIADRELFKNVSKRRNWSFKRGVIDEMSILESGLKEVFSTFKPDNKNSKPLYFRGFNSNFTEKFPKPVIIKII